MNTEILKAPKAAEEILKLYRNDLCSSEKRIAVRIAIDASDMVERDVDDFDDFVDGKIIQYGGHLEDIFYTPVAVNERHMIVMEIDAELVFDNSDDEWDTAFEKGLGEYEN